MKGFNDIKWFWIIYCVIFLALGWGMASCNETANAVEGATMHGDTHSHTQLIDLNLSTARVDEQHKVTARQIFYDIGSDPSKAGYVTVKINSTQSAPISMTPGGEINYDDIESIYVSNTLQLGKSVRLLVNNNTTIKNPPSNPLSTPGIKTIPFSTIEQFIFNQQYGAGASFGGVGTAGTVATIIDEASNVNGINIHSISLSYSSGSTSNLDFISIAVVASAHYGFFPTYRHVEVLKSTQHLNIKNTYIPPGLGLAIVANYTNVHVPSVANMQISCSTLFERL